MTPASAVAMNSNNRKQRRLPLWVFTILPPVIMNIGTVVILGGYFASIYAHGGDPASIDQGQLGFWMFAGITLAEWVFAALLILDLRRAGISLRELFAPMSKTRPFRWAPFWVMFGLYNAIWIGYLFVTRLSGQWPDYAGLAPWQIALFLTVIPISPAIIEESIWLGTIIPRLEEHGSTRWTAVVLSAISFSLIHGIFLPTRLAATLLIGLAAGWYSTRERRLLPLIITHAFMNLWSFGVFIFIR